MSEVRFIPCQPVSNIALFRQPNRGPLWPHGVREEHPGAAVPAGPARPGEEARQHRGDPAQEVGGQQSGQAGLPGEEVEAGRAGGLPGGAGQGEQEPRHQAALRHHWGPQEDDHRPEEPRHLDPHNPGRGAREERGHGPAHANVQEIPVHQQQEDQGKKSLDTERFPLILSPLRSS